MSLYNLVSFCGIFVLMFIAWLFSPEKRIINLRLIGWGLTLQMLFALFIFVFPPGAEIFLFINGLVVKVMESAMAGVEFVFGRLALSPAKENSLGFFFAFQGLPTIIFFSAVVSILYYVGIMQRVIGLFAKLFTRLLRISGAESLCAASNIFVGVESSLTVKPFLESMTKSELTTVLTTGMATVASNILAVYVFCLSDQFPSIAGHLISASFLSAPAAIIMSKLVMPETGAPVTLGKHVEVHYQREQTVFEAIVNGANTGVRLIVGIVALLIAVLGLVALADLCLIGIGGMINDMSGLGLDWSLRGMMGYLFYPLTLILGVPPSDAVHIARIIGERTIVTELTAYQDLAVLMGQDVLEHGRSAVICAYALCGFAHVASVAIFIGGISAVAPKTTGTLSRIGFRALLAATLACLMTGCIAGTFFTEGSVLF